MTERFLDLNEPLEESIECIKLFISTMKKGLKNDVALLEEGMFEGEDKITIDKAVQKRLRNYQECLSDIELEFDYYSRNVKK